MVHNAAPSLHAIFTAHLPKVLRAVRRSGVAARDAEDVAQDVFVAVNGALTRYDLTRPIEPWLLTIAYRTARDYQAKSARREDPSEDMDGEDHAQDPERDVLAREAARLFLDLVAGLDEHQREVYMLAEIDGCTVPEIAAALDVPIGTAASRLARGRAAFDDALNRMRRDESKRSGSSAACIPILLASPSSILDIVRRLPTVAADTTARLWAGVSASVAARVAATGIIAAALAYTSRQLVGAIVAAAIVGAATGGGTVYGMLGGSTSREVAPVAIVGSAAPVRAPSGDEVAPVATSQPSIITTSPIVIVAATAAPSSTQAVSTDRDEMALLDRARADLAGGRDAAALASLQRHRSKYPRGVYAVERDALITRANARIDVHDGDPE